MITITDNTEIVKKEFVANLNGSAVNFELVYKDGILESVLLTTSVEKIKLTPIEFEIIGIVYKSIDPMTERDEKIKTIVQEKLVDRFGLLDKDPEHKKDKIGAIKELRVLTGIGLKEAKDQIEYLIQYGVGPFVSKYRF